MSDIIRRDPRAEWIARNRLHPLHAAMQPLQHSWMSIEIHDGTKKASWQRKYKATFDDELLDGSISDYLSASIAPLSSTR